jgi:hypothetical protein
MKKHLLFIIAIIALASCTKNNNETTTTTISPDKGCYECQTSTVMFGNVGSVSYVQFVMSDTCGISTDSIESYEKWIAKTQSNSNIKTSMI